MANDDRTVSMFAPHRIGARMTAMVVAIAVVLFGGGGARADEGSPAVFISEVGWAGSSVSQADEWIEIGNTGSASVDISGWFLEGMGSSGAVITLPAGSVIEAGGTYLIANYGAGDVKSTLAVSVQLVTTSVSISNAALSVVLRKTDGEMVDHAGNGGVPFAGGSLSSGGIASMQRTDSAADGTTAAAWKQATVSIGFDPGAPDLGSPGFLEEDLLDVSPNTEETSPQTPLDDVEVDSADLVDSVEGGTQEDVASLPVSNSSESASPDSEEATLPDSAQSSSESISDPSTENEVDAGSDSPSNEQENLAVVLDVVEEVTPAVDVPITYPLGTLVINEFVSDPISGEKEWVEIFNPFNNVIPLAGWRVRESSGRTVTLPDQWFGFEQFIVAEFSSSALNNDADTIELLDPTGVVIDRVVYGTDFVPSATDPYAVARDVDGTFRVTDVPTPGSANLFPAPILAQENSEEDAVVQAPLSIAEEDPQKREEEIETVPSPAVLFSLLRDIRLSEIFPNPKGSDEGFEFIEVENRGKTEADLFGLVLEDESGSRWAVADHRVVPTGGFTTFYGSSFGFSLNNTGRETIRIFAPDGELLDEMSYEDAPEDRSYVYLDAGWGWSSVVTPDKPNALPADDVGSSEDKGASNNTLKTAVVSAPSIDPFVLLESLQEIRQMPLGTRVRVRAVVSAAPGTFGEGIFSLTDASGGIQVFVSSAGTVPTVSIGDVVETTGEIRTARGETRLTVGKEGSVVFVEHGPLPVPISVEAIGRETEGQLVRVSGRFVSQSGDKILLEAGQETVQIRLKGAVGETKFPAESAGSLLEVTGIVSRSGDAFILLPRSVEDLRFPEAVTSPAPAASVSIPVELTGKESDASARGHIGLILAGLTLAGLSGFAFRFALKKYTLRRLSTKSSYENAKLPASHAV